jgi:hypothetical protein
MDAVQMNIIALNTAIAATQQLIDFDSWLLAI